MIITAMENTINIKKIVGARLRDARDAKHLSREELCDRINTVIRCAPNYNPSSPYPPYLVASTYRAWEDGTNKINIEYIPVLKSVLDFDVGYLFGEYPEFHKEVADICAITGLTEEAVAALVERVEESRAYISVSNPHNVLSSLLTDNRFWQTLRSISYYIFPESVSPFLETYNIHWPDPSTESLMKELDDKYFSEYNIITYTGRDSIIAGIARCFGNIAERVIDCGIEKY